MPTDPRKILRPPVAGESEKEQIRSRIKRDTLLSFAFGIPGIAGQIGGRVMMAASSRTEAPPNLDTGTRRPLNASEVTGCGIVFLGLILLLVGLGFAARAKGRHWAWSLLGLLSCIGLLILHFMGKVCSKCGEKASNTATGCLKCTAPM